MTGPSGGPGEDATAGALGETMALMAHELRTPLALIKGYVTTLLHLPNLTETERRHYLGGIEQANSRLIALVDNVLDMAAIEAGRLRLDRHEEQLDSLVRRVVRQLQTQTTIHRLRVRSPRPLRSLLFDAGRIEQVIANLLGNAIKYSPDGGLIEISLTEADWAEIGTLATGGEHPVSGAIQVVRVRDQGRGIPEAELPRLFDKFQRGAWREERTVRGTGLGLYLCRAIIGAHGGAIWAENYSEGGARFGFCLPVVDGAASGR
jgi:signal transduction histidine kinase